MVVLAIIPVTFLSCDKPTVETTASNAESVRPLPASAIRFHKPKELKTAVSRMRELHDAITSSEPLPEPIEYQIKEVVHGTGASGHSHYYLRDHESSSSEPEHDETEDHDHDHETSDEKIHDVKVDAFVELKDLAKWLPKIASDSNMAESEWSKVNDISKQMTPMLSEIVKQSTDNDKRRASYRDQAVALEGYLLSSEQLSE